MMGAWREIKDEAVGYHEAYRDALDRPQYTQEKILKGIVARNHHTRFGQRYGFSNIESVASFQQQVPIQYYSDFQSSIEDMLDGTKNVLCGEPVLMYEKTSGTSAVPKFIPYTQTALESFHAAIFPWLYDLCEAIPEIMGGGAYWSISPIDRPSSHTVGGVSIGLNNDALYFGETVAKSIAQTLVVPHWVSQIKNIDTWQYITLRYLVAAPNLRLISVWSPTFLLQLLEELPNYLDTLVEDIACGTLSYAGLEPFASHINLIKDPARARLIRSSVSGVSVDTQRLWPELRLISCWASAGSQVYAERLKSQFPHAILQPKGLLATEGVVTIPITAAGQPVLALLSGFYEFMADDGQLFLCEQLECGKTYTVLVTNNSGLYRYCIGDRVTVTGWLSATPCLEFVGRTSSTDLCGEKLTEQFVWPLLSRISGFTLLVGNTQPSPHYCLYVDAEVISPEQIHELSCQLETELSVNPQYAYARKLKQLKSVKVIRVDRPMNRYRDRLLKKSHNLGDIKPPCLSQDAGWHSCFGVGGGYK